MTIEHVQPQKLFAIEGMSQVVVTRGRQVYIAGQGAFDAEFQLVGQGDFFAQTLKAFDNLKEALAAVGARPEQVVSSTTYIVGLTDHRTDEYVRAMQQALDGKPFPPHASTVVGVSRLAYESMLVEISAIAVID